MKDMKITFSDDVREFSSWMCEKCGNVLSSLCLMLKEKPELSEDASFTQALDDALLVFALVNEHLNGIHTKMVNQLLINYNMEGYYFLKDLINKSCRSNLMKKAIDFQPNEEIIELIEENNKLNRTKIAEKIYQLNYQSPWIKQIANDLEYVHNNEKTWDWFYTKHCNDKANFKLTFEDDFIKEIYDYFNSEEFENSEKLSDLTLYKEG